MDLSETDARQSVLLVLQFHMFSSESELRAKSPHPQIWFHCNREALWDDENYGKLYGTCEIKEVLPLIISHDAGRLNFQIRKRSRHQTHCICTHPASLIPQIPRRKNTLVYSMDRRMRTNQVCHWDGWPFWSIKICFTALPFCFLEPEVTMSGWEGGDGRISWLDLNQNSEHIVGVACQSQGSHALKHTVFYHLFYNNLDHKIQNENIIPCLKRL